jgi:hypothetical protein
MSYQTPIPIPAAARGICPHPRQIYQSKLKALPPIYPGILRAGGAKCSVAFSSWGYLKYPGVTPGNRSAQVTSTSANN